MLLNQNYKGVPGAVNYYYYSDAKLTRPHIEFYAGDTLDGIMSIISPMYAPAIILASALLQMAYIPEDGMPNAVKRTRYPRLYPT